MVRVRPGVELTCAIVWLSREVARLDLPTLERPRKANSGGPSGGKNLGSAAEVRNLAMRGFIRSTNQCSNCKGSPQVYAAESQIKKKSHGDTENSLIKSSLRKNRPFALSIRAVLEPTNRNYR